MNKGKQSEPKISMAEYFAKKKELDQSLPDQVKAVAQIEVKKPNSPKKKKKITPSKTSPNRVSIFKASLYCITKV